MTATWINVGTVILGTLIGLIVKSRLKPQYEEIVLQTLGLYTLLLGVIMGMKGNEVVAIILSLVIGAVIGEAIQLSKHFNRLGEEFGKRVPGSSPSFSQGLSIAFLLFCIGPMSTLGALEDGLGQTPSLLYTKSILDGVTSVVLSASFGPGIVLTIFPLILLQGGTSLLAQSLQGFLDTHLIDQLSAVGGVMMLGIGINILKIKDLKVINMLPALILIIIMVKISRQIL